MVANLASNGFECAQRACTRRELDSLCFTSRGRLPNAEVVRLQNLQNDESLTTYEHITTARPMRRAAKGNIRKGTIGLIKVEKGKNYEYIAQYTSNARFGVPPAVDIDNVNATGSIWYVPMRIFRIMDGRSVPYKPRLRETPVRFGPGTLSSALASLREIYDL